MIKHYPFGSSTAARTDACQGWRAQSEGVPRKESQFAVDGTIVHGILEQLALGEAEPDIVEGHKVEKDHRVMAREIWALTEDFLSDHGVTEWEPEVTATTAEDVGGTLDLVGASADKTILLDYKTGQGVQVDPCDNKQILFAAANVIHGESGADDLIRDKFLGVIVQPDRAGDIRIKTWEFDREIVDRWWKQHQDNIAIARGADLDNDTVAGDHCKFCPANGLCPATTGRLLKMKQFHPDDLEVIKEGLDMVEDVKQTIKAIEQKAYDALEAGQEIPGWKLVRGRPGHTTWDDPEAALKLLKKLTRGLKDEDGERLALQMEVRKAITPTQAKKILKAHEVPADVLDECTHRPEPKGFTLAPESDKREAVLSAEAFGAALDSIK